MRHLLSFSVFFATLQLVLSLQTTNRFDCITDCGNSIRNLWDGTICDVTPASSSWGFNTCPSNSMGGGLLLSCYDWCGYQYKKTGGFGWCTTKPDGAACGATSGRKQETYKCVDYETNNGDKCSGSAPVSYVDCEKTACPPPSCSSGKCVGRTGIYCDNVVVTGTGDVSITNQGCRATISSNVQGCCDCGGCSGSSTSSGKHFSSSALFFCLQFNASTSRCTSF
jgi:hypothetical protein